ncbi:uncharacterized protein LOC115675758 isoform X2 [Syzygium oleosum]|uniref:uncharacterized protein LOC115675758 isoform X2 n=1 Tax=Syzygium oleosum TaxID=219896 RepID=UPI0024B8DFAF|nr:uncharacterized protein LOC115675758 isoform X2 [Syzygium oleosum]
MQSADRFAAYTTTARGATSPTPPFSEPIVRPPGPPLPAHVGRAGRVNRQRPPPKKGSRHQRDPDPEPHNGRHVAVNRATISSRRGRGEPTQLVVLSLSVSTPRTPSGGERDRRGGGGGRGWWPQRQSICNRRERSEKVSPSPLLPVSVSLLLLCGPVPPEEQGPKQGARLLSKRPLCAAVRGMRMPCWDRFKHPLKNVWIGLATRLRMRKSGLLKLRHDVRRCEYDDVHVMWEMLERNEKEIAQSSRRMKKRSFWSIFGWARCAPYLRRSF